MEKLQVAQGTTALAETAVELGKADATGRAGKAAMRIVAGTMAQHLPSKSVENLVGKSNSFVVKAKKEVSVSQKPCFDNPPPVSRNPYTEDEKMAVREWMLEKNPARSGDEKARAWMSKTKTAFYSEEYRSVEGMIEIIERACRRNPSLRNVEIPNTIWLRNVKTYQGCISFANYPVLYDLNCS